MEHSAERNVYLIGPRACGKTSLGRELARALDRPFVDTDRELLARLGCEVAEFVAASGWEEFRDREAETLAAVAVGSGIVVATGGGIVLRPENRAVLARGLTIYLKAEPALLAARLAANPLPGQRPSLTGRPPEEEIASVLAEREPLYLGCANIVLDASLPLRELVRALLPSLPDECRPGNSEDK